MSGDSTSWRPSASLPNLQLRARMLAATRAFFAARDVLEVETPLLSSAGTTDPQIESFVSHYAGPGLAGRRYLHTSPEFAMKRLLASGSGSIYQIAKVFRNGEYGRLHNPEFTLLEWYRVGWNHHALMEEVAALIAELLRARLTLAGPEYLTYRAAFQRHCAVDPFVDGGDAFAAAAQRHGIVLANAPELDRDTWCDVLLTHVIQPQLGRGRVSFLYDYPPSQAALARIRNDAPPVAERFEAYVNGIELANGFHELAQRGEQTARFAQDNRVRAERNLVTVTPDAHLLAALEHLPACAGVALGFDRLVLLAAGADNLNAVIAFPFERA